MTDHLNVKNQRLATLFEDLGKTLDIISNLANNKVTYTDTVRRRLLHALNLIKPDVVAIDSDPYSFTPQDILDTNACLCNLQQLL